MEEVTFGDLIKKITSDLWESFETRKREGRVPLFELSGLDLEIAFVVTSQGKGGLGFDVKIVRADGEYSRENQAVQRAVVHLSAITSGDSVPELEDFGESLPLRPRKDFR
jgi:hypothetical protein